MILRRQKLFATTLEPDIIKQFLGHLSGFIHTAKVLHWAANGKDIHEYLDQIWEETYKFQDTMAEGWMGINGQLDSDVPYLPTNANTPHDFILELEEKVQEFYALLPDDDDRWKGLKGEVESFIQTVEKYKYLFGLCDDNKEE